jgi:hypothetical protein
MITEKFKYVLYCDCGTKTPHVLTESGFKTRSGLICMTCLVGKVKTDQKIRRFKIEANNTPGEQKTLF